MAVRSPCSGAVSALDLEATLPLQFSILLATSMAVHCPPEWVDFPPKTGALQPVKRLKKKKAATMAYVSGGS